MPLFGNKNDEAAKLCRLLKEKQKKEKQLNKEWNKRLKNKYTAKNLKAAKNILLEQAQTIDSLEYEKITAELKERLNK
ncbi:MAG: hypothetical protein NC078_06015 [Ruminococcus sp.]|nr:hypothetical protein [Ruminococcus sp.]